jgi:hypothetical protein
MVSTAVASCSGSGRRPDIVPRYTARAEFTRADASSPWRLVGVWIAGRFFAAPGAPERPRRRPHPDVGWTELPTPIVGPDVDAAAAIALDVAQTTWPERAGRR